MLDRPPDWILLALSLICFAVGFILMVYGLIGIING